MKHVALKSLAIALATGAALMAVTAAAQAGPMYVFNVSTGTQPSNVGTITLTQNGAGVDVSVDLLTGYGIVNTGGPHTPFGFNLSGSLAGLTISHWTTPASGSYTNTLNNSGTFSLDTAGGSTPSYGNFNVALDDSAGNGSSKGYFGDLLFTLTRNGGLDTNDFVANGAGYFFTADLSNNINSGNTGAQAWSEGIDPPTSVPEPFTMSLFGMGLAGMAGLRRRKSISGAAVA